ncbi:uncharacterized protein LOC142345952 [Convolutriloba macropyga]|uniref:uncharacterized protein LOC142345952 n=1 Tax=Convolutriloba macropyga TaxID=536237 RepID=UPI003F527614
MSFGSNSLILPSLVLVLGFNFNGYFGSFGVSGVSGLVTQEIINEKTTLECFRNGFVVYMDADLVLDGVASDESVLLYVGNTTVCNYTGNLVSGTDNDFIYRTVDGSQYVFNFSYPDCDSSRGYLMDYLDYEAVIGRNAVYIPGNKLYFTDFDLLYPFIRGMSIPRLLCALEFVPMRPSQIESASDLTQTRRQFLSAQ